MRNARNNQRTGGPTLLFNIPVPARGNWAKLQAGKHDKRWPLPARALGQPDVVWVGRDEYDRGSDDADILNSPIPPPPVFSPAMSIVETQAAALVRKAPLPLREDYGWHSQIQKRAAKDRRVPA